MMIVDVVDPSQVSAARRAALDVARTMGFDEEKSGRLALVATEMATNLIKHAASGKIVIERYNDVEGVGVELLALDSGGGIADVRRAMADGFSSAGTSGGGLGAIERQADHFGIFSRPQLGTAIVARIEVEKASTAAGSTQLGSVTLPFPGESACGDAWAFANTPAGPTLFAVDGSGHGLHAERAAQTAIRIFHEHANESCTDIIEAVHRGLAPTRGGAVAVARVDAAARAIRFVGVGNIGAAVVNGADVKRMVSHNGTAGLIAPRIREFTYPLTGNPIVLLHSDGISSKWDFAKYPGLSAGHPSLVAGILMRDHRRGRDDACVVVMRA